MIDVVLTTSTKYCDIQCDDDKFDRCGGKTIFFSAYKLTDMPMSKLIYLFDGSYVKKQSNC